ncbi:prephenate dehydratase [Propionibacteriaceae bacterium Y1685]|uniref:prephenate dehydratase n=1 Tax=Microlunatus sp. Y1700 TaxID=3418487 RepID=UPI003B763099
MTTYGYLGPQATFTHQALGTLAGLDGFAGVEQATAYPDVLSTLDAVLRGEVDRALVPIENSVEGGVSATLDQLVNGAPLMIIGEVLLPVTFCLCARPGTTVESITRLITHPVADAQVRGWIATHLKGVEVVHAGSTAGAAERIAAAGEPGDAAVCARIAADTHGLTVLADGIADNASAVTRFVLVSRPGRPPAPTGADKTTLVLFQRNDHSGALLEILEQFAGRGVNLCRIESRPTKTALGSYCFTVDAEGHLADARLAEAMMGLHRICADIRFLGSYPRADRQPAEVTPYTTNESFAAARRWLDEQGGISSEA